MPFGPGDAPFFFGRQRERRLIAANLTASRLTLLYGQTGVGKSSVLRAGVEHDLRGLARRELSRGVLPEWIPVVFSSWRDDPLLALREAIAETLSEIFGDLAPEPPAAVRLDEQLEQWTAALDVLAEGADDDRHARLLIVLDQFEEYFLYHVGEDGEGTIAVELPRAISREGLRANFLISIREDAYAQLGRFKGRIPNLFENYRHIRHLDRESARQAVTEPITVYNSLLPPNETPFAWEDELVEVVLNEVKAGTVVLGQAGTGSVAESGEARIEAPFLQLVMRRLWLDARAAGDRMLTLARLRELGGAGPIVRAHLQEAMELLEPDDRDVAARVFHHLVTPSGAKIAQTLADLAGYADIERERLLPMLDTLARARILRYVDPPPGDVVPRFEIYHDVLALAVLDWRTAFVNEQHDAERRRVDRRRLLKRAWAVGGILLVVASVVSALLAGWAVRARDDARSSAREATALSFARASDDRRIGHLDLALLLGLAADRMRDRAEARGSVISALADAARSGAIALLHGHRTAVRAVAFTPDGLLVSAGNDGTVRLWDARTRRQVGQLARKQESAIYSLAISPDGDTVATGGTRGLVQLWSLRTRRQLGQPLERYPGRVYSVAFSHDGQTLATATRRGTIRLWSVRTHRQLGPLRGRGGGAVLSVAFSPDGTGLASASRDGTVGFWNVASHRLRASLRVSPGNPVLSVAFSRDGRLLATATRGGIVRVWNARTLEPVARLAGHHKAVRSVAFDASGARLASASNDGTVALWSLRQRRAIRILPGDGSRVLSVAFSPDGRIWASGAQDGTIWLRDVRGHPGFRELARTPALRVGFGAGGHTLATVGYGSVRLWNLGAGRVTAQRLPARGISYGLALSPSRGTLAVSSYGGTVQLWDARTGRPLGAPLRSGHDPVWTVAWGSDTLLASAGDDGAVRLWRTADRRLVATLRDRRGPVYTLSFSPDGRVLAAAGKDGTIRVWDVRTRRLLGRPLGGDKGSVYAIAFLPDRHEHRLLSAGAAGAVRLWDLDLGTAVNRPLSVSRGAIYTLAVSPDGRVLATGGADQTVRLWDLHDWKPLERPLLGGIGSVYDVAFSPDGRMLASASADGTVRLSQGVFWFGRDELRSRICRLVGGNLTAMEWKDIASGLEPGETCPRR